MNIDQKLLWKAYPSGTVCRVGVQTLEGWICTARIENGGFLFIDGESYDDEIVVRGNVWEMNGEPMTPNNWLLPDVDPTNIATWACLIAELGDSISRWEGPAWGIQKIDKKMWALIGPSTNTLDEYLFSGIKTKDMSKALVMAQIMIRENA